MKSRKPMVEIARALLTAEEVSKGSANVPISQARAAGSEEALGNTEEG